MRKEAVLIDRDGNPTLRFERRLGAPLERVWRAVTDEEEMRSWFPSAVQGERKVGAPLRFPFDDNVADTFDGEVTEWDPMSVFAFTWNGDQLRIELTADGDATTLVFTQTIGHMTEAARTGSGWHFCLDNLDAHLGGPTADPDTWKTVYPEYLERMGPPLGTPMADGSMVWQRTHFVPAGEVGEVFTQPERWGAVADREVSCEASAAAHGSEYRVTHRSIGADAALAARWHALLTQLDMYLAAKQIVPADPGLFVDDYTKLLD